MRGRGPDLKRDLLEDPDAVPHNNLIAILKDEAPLFGRALGRENRERRAALGLIGLVDNDNGQPLCARLNELAYAIAREELPRSDRRASAERPI